MRETWFIVCALCLALGACTSSGDDVDEGPSGAILQDGVWVFYGSHDVASEACETCVDQDADGLSDAFEDELLAAVVPSMRADELEPALASADWGVAAVGRVMPVDASTLRVFIMLGWQEDYGWLSGGCVDTFGEGFTAHPGDSERVVVTLVATPDGGWALHQAYTAAHEFTPDDQSAIHDGTALEFTAEPRWRVYSSLAKHGTYISHAACEGVTEGICTVDEACGLDANDERVPMVVNAGEPSAPRVTDLSSLGFPGDDAWAEQLFCGGQTRSEACVDGVHNKLTQDPFAP